MLISGPFLLVKQDVVVEIEKMYNMLCLKKQKYFFNS